MGLIDTILALALQVVTLIAQKDRDKYNAKLLQLKNDYYAERNKLEAERDFALIDNLEFEIELTANALLMQASLNK